MTNRELRGYVQRLYRYKSISDKQFSKNYLEESRKLFFKIVEILNPNVAIVWGELAKPANAFKIKYTLIIKNVKNLNMHIEKNGEIHYRLTFLNKTDASVPDFQALKTLENPIFEGFLDEGRRNSVSRRIYNTAITEFGERRMRTHSASSPKMAEKSQKS